jgi:membrane protease YdiL (CAAX protease family)
MNLKDLFVARNRLRPLWRVFLFFFPAFLALHSLTLLLWNEVLLRYVLVFCVLFGLSFFFAHIVDKRPLALIGFGFHSRWLKEYGLGVFIGAICVSFLFLFMWSAGFFELEFTSIHLTLLVNIFIFSLLTTLFQSAFEELLFRGYLYQNLILATGAVVATAVLSLLFGIGHLLTPNAKLLTAVNLSAFGVLHALAYLKTRSLWLPSGLHFGWNFFMRNIYSLPCSGTEAQSSLLAIKEHGPVWLTGGNYGPEGGIPALLVLLAACLIIAYWRKIKIHPEMRILWENIRS